MKILVANLGSTSFKYRLFDMADGEARALARGSVERIGSPESLATVEIGSHRGRQTISAPDHAAALGQCMADLTHPEFGCLGDASEVSAVGFKAVHGGSMSGVQPVTDELLSAMEAVSRVAPAHNPPYIHAMRLLHEKLPEIPMVAVLETDFHRTIPDRNRYYAAPYDWAEQYGIKRWGFHGASHRYIAARMTELLGTRDSGLGAREEGTGEEDERTQYSVLSTHYSKPSTLNPQLSPLASHPSPLTPHCRVISCHLGGSSSLCAIRDGQSVATSMGMSPQSGLAQNNRVGDFDPFALPVVMERSGKSLDEVLDVLANQSGLLGLSGTSGDVRDLLAASDSGDARAKLALDVFVAGVRHYLGAYLVELGGADAIVFTGGIGENRPRLREMICRELEELGIVLDADANHSATGEAAIHADASRTQIWIVPTNEELIVARMAQQFLEG